MQHQFPIRVYYEDTDAAGVVYYANYLKFAERGRTELLRSGGLGNKSLAEAQNLVFVVRHINADYLKPARLDDLLTLNTSIIQLKHASVLMQQFITLQSDVIFKLDVVLASIDAQSFRPARITETLRQAFQPFLKAS